MGAGTLWGLCSGGVGWSRGGCVGPGSGQRSGVVMSTGGEEGQH